MFMLSTDPPSCLTIFKKHLRAKAPNAQQSENKKPQGREYETHLMTSSRKARLSCTSVSALALYTTTRPSETTEAERNDSQIHNEVT